MINYPRLVEKEASMAGTKGEIAGIYKLLEQAGFTKDDIRWWRKTSKTNVAEAMETMQRRLGLCNLMGHALGRRIDLFDKDRTPVEDAAYAEGRAVGLVGGPNANPYGMESIAGQNWQRGLNDGNSERNKIIAESLNDNIIKGSEPDEGGDADDYDDADQDAGDDDDEAAVSDDDDWDAADPARAAE